MFVVDFLSSKLFFCSTLLAYECVMSARVKKRERYIERELFVSHAGLLSSSSRFYKEEEEEEGEVHKHNSV